MINNCQYEGNNPPKHNYCEHKHVHEIQGSVMIAEREKDPHNHRFTAVSGEAIQIGMDHYHEVIFRTDFYDGHFHEFYGRTSCVIPVGDRHVHFIESFTTENDCHCHEFRLATMIENPIEGKRC